MWTREQIEKLADRFAEIFAESVETIGGKAQIEPREEDYRLPCAICGEPNEIGDICANCARIHAPVDDDENLGLAAGHGWGY